MNEQANEGCEAAVDRRGIVRATWTERGIVLHIGGSEYLCRYQSFTYDPATGALSVEGHPGFDTENDPACQELYAALRAGASNTSAPAP